MAFGCRHKTDSDSIKGLIKAALRDRVEMIILLMDTAQVIHFVGQIIYSLLGDLQIVNHEKWRMA